MQEELEVMKPQLEEASKETEQTLVDIEVDTVIDFLIFIV